MTFEDDDDDDKQPTNALDEPSWKIRMTTTTKQNSSANRKRTATSSGDESTRAGTAPSRTDTSESGTEAGRTTIGSSSSETWGTDGDNRTRKTLYCLLGLHYDLRTILCVREGPLRVLSRCETCSEEPYSEFIFLSLSTSQRL